MTNENRKISHIILGISIRTLVNLIFVFFLVEGFVTAYHFSYKLFSDRPNVPASQDTMNITIAEGETPFDIAKTLEENQIVESRYLFLARAFIGKYNARIQYGTYTLGPGMSPDEICKRICRIQSEATS